MRDLSQCTFTGRLGFDAEIRYTAGGGAVTNLSLAVGRDFKPKGSDTWTERTLWLRCSLWDRLAEKHAELKKGQPVMVIGELEPDDYEKDGVRVQRVQLRVTAIELLHRPSREAAAHATGDAPARGGSNRPARNTDRQQPPPSSRDDFEDDEIPF